MKRLQIRRGGPLMAAATFALVVLAACGSPGEEADHEDVTRVPTMSDAAAQATREAPPPGATPGATPEGGEATPGTREATPGTGETAGTAAPGAAAQSVEVVSFDIYFEPTELTIPADTDVPFVLPNQGVTAHNFAIDELGIDVDIAPGATEEVVINAPAGEYEYYCNVPGHKAAGMVGTLIVTDEGGEGAAASEEETAAAQAGAATAPAAAPEPAAEEAAEDEAAAAGAEPVEVVSLDIFFEPTEVTVPADTDVPFVLPNEGVTAHNFAIDALGIDVDITPGATEEIVVNAPAGTYEYYCNVPGHKAAGMAGTLTVE